MLVCVVLSENNILKICSSLEEANKLVIENKLELVCKVVQATLPK
jgi:hypothetical protein